MAFNPENTEALGKRELTDKDPIIVAEAVKMSKWAHHDAVLGAKAVLGMADDEDLSKDQVSHIKHKVFENKYEYLVRMENNEDPY